MGIRAPRGAADHASWGASTAPPAELYDQIGPDVLLVHGYEWGAAVWQRLAERGVKLSVSSYSAVSGGTPIPFRELFEAGIQVSLSFDSLAGGNADMFRMLRFTADVVQLGGTISPTGACSS